MSARFDLSALFRHRSAQLALASLTVVVVITLVTFAARAWWVETNSAAKQDGAAAQPTPARGNLRNKLSLQPEADRLRRRLGQRFLAQGREVSVLLGALTLGSERSTVRIVRSQDDDVERLTIALNGGQPALSWSSADGARSGNDPATGSVRELIERIALDSPDQFILAQGRGASYYTVARMVRPPEAGNSRDYKGPVWDVVRIGEPVGITQNKPQSLWRLYYINSATGLIDKIFSREQGETITAEVSGWVNQGGEQVPTRLAWFRNKQMVMELIVNNVSHSPRQ
jgi:hypothetical protein